MRGDRRIDRNNEMVQSAMDVEYSIDAQDGGAGIKSLEEYI